MTLKSLKQTKMKTKKLYTAAAAAILSLGAASCSDFLEVDPSTQVSEVEFYKTEEDMLKGLYAVINEVQTRLPEVMSYSSLLSDESETGGGLGEGMWKEWVDQFQYTPTNAFGKWGYGSWWNEWDFGLFNGVVAANLLIDKLDASSLPAEISDPMRAEARFYRALFYYYLWMDYEEIPLQEHYLTADQMYSVHQGTRQEVYEFMLSDLAPEIIKNLPARQSTVQGRVCQEAAKLLRAKIILFHRDAAAYQSALDDLKSMIGGYMTLNTDFRLLWLKEGEWCPESIFEVCYAGNNSGESFALCHSLSGRGISDPRSADQGGLYDGYGQNTVPSTVVRRWDAADTRLEGSIITYEDEARKVDALVAAGELPAGSKFIWSTEQEKYEGFGHYKYHARKESTSASNPGSNHYNSWRLFRYADVLLLAAELDCRIKNAGTADAQTWLDMIRDRAFQDKNHRVEIKGKSLTAALDILFEERGLEFFDEMQRWFDIMRFDKGVELLGDKGFTEKHRYFPIDQTEIDRSNGGLRQSPSWR